MMNWSKCLNPAKNTEMAKKKKEIFNGIKGKVRFEEPLKKHTTFKIGGPAKFFIEPLDLKDLRTAVSLARAKDMPVFLLGTGSNILANDRGVSGIVLQLNSPFFRKISRKNNILEVGSWLLLGKLVKYASQHGLSGIEFLAGIPGTVGGALAMNAGAWGENLGNIVEEVKVMDYNGNINTLSKKNIKFDYRKSSLSKYIILSCRIKLAKKNKEQIKDNINKYIKLRASSQDSSYPNAGCIFKNPSSVESAGKLIDLCSLKNKRIGGACVSGKHANFILNRANANSNDVLKLMHLIETKVKQKFNINLEPEIKIWL